MMYYFSLCNLRLHLLDHQTIRLLFLIVSYHDQPKIIPKSFQCFNSITIILYSFSINSLVSFISSSLSILETTIDNITILSTNFSITFLTDLWLSYSDNN